jgi:hypothetical protein
LNSAGEAVEKLAFDIVLDDRGSTARERRHRRRLSSHSKRRSPSRLLKSLRSDSEAERCFAWYREELDHNELELALDALEHLAGSSTLPAAIWEALAVAAESMDLFERAAVLRKMKSE